MTIEEILRERRITEILHFTTNTGILGILDTKQLKARDRLNDDARLEYIFTPNAKDRTRDTKWHGYVNLSVSRINTWFATSSGNWHRHKDVWWCILSFSPEILNHEGVIFTTTNNIYTSVKRAPKGEGFEAMFAQKVVWYQNKFVERTLEIPASYTTCEQAEVLYPGEVSTSFLRKIYVPNEAVADEIAGQINAVRHPEVKIEVRESLFTSLV